MFYVLDLKPASTKPPRPELPASLATRGNWNISIDIEFFIFLFYTPKS